MSVQLHQSLTYATAGLVNTLVVLKVDFLILHHPPQPLNKNIVKHAALVIHTNGYTGRFQNPYNVRKNCCGGIAATACLGYCTSMFSHMARKISFWNSIILGATMS